MDDSEVNEQSIRQTMQPTWEFWIDVGGTFTDCLARRDDGSLVTFKLLSSGVTKGQCSGASKGGDWIEDPSRCSDPAGFWTGYCLRLLDEAGRVWETRRVAGFERKTGRLTLDQPFERDVPVGTPYELASGEEAPLERSLKETRSHDPPLSFPAATR